MAKNWTIKEAFVAIKNGDMESIMDLGKRFPLATNLITRLTVTKDNPAIGQFVSLLPDYNTVGKLNTVLKEGVKETTEPEEVEEKDSEVKAKEEVKPAKKEKKESSGAKKDLESMNAQELYKYGKNELGIKFKSTKKADMLAAIKEHLNGSEENDVEEVEETKEESAYAGKSAKELFLICKERKIKVEPKKPAKFYEDILLKDDAKKAAEVEEDDDWGDEEDEKPAPKKSEKKVKKVEKEEETDEWDI